MGNSNRGIEIGGWGIGKRVTRRIRELKTRNGE